MFSLDFKERWIQRGLISTHRVHPQACAEVGQFEVSVLVQQHVVRFNITVDEAHGVDSVQRQHDFSRVETSPLLRDVIVYGERDQVSSRHELHHHIEVVVVLESTAELQNCSHIVKPSCQKRFDHIYYAECTSSLNNLCPSFSNKQWACQEFYV